MVPDVDRCAVFRRVIPEDDGLSDERRVDLVYPLLEEAR
jgi:hypothetical protein